MSQYQLVIQMPAADMSDFDRLLAIEDLIATAIGSQGIVDGHDFGSGEANIFIHCDDPARVFRVVYDRVIVPENRVVAAAYRAFDGEIYTVLYPPGLTTFKVS